MRSVAPKSIARWARGALHRMLILAADRIRPQTSATLEQRLARGDVVWRAFRDAGHALVRARRFHEADEALERALAAFPNDEDFLFDYAMSAHNGGRYGVAVDRWKAALAVAPDVAMCHAGLAANRRMLGDSVGATAVIEAVLGRFPTDLTIVTEAARCAEQRGAFDAALALWQKAIDAGQSHPEWLRGKAYALFSLKRVEEARTVLAHALRQHPTDQPLRAMRDLMDARGS